jgi:hypothetical protein
MQNFDQNIDFLEKRQFSRRKLSKIAENCDHRSTPELPKIYFKSGLWLTDTDTIPGGVQGHADPAHSSEDDVLDCVLKSKDFDHSLLLG